MKYESTEQKIFKIIYPPVLYFFISMAVQMIVSIVLIISDIRNTGILHADINKSANYFEQIDKMITNHSVLMNVIAAAIGLVIFMYLYNRDLRDNNERKLQEELTPIPPFDICKCYIIGISAGMGINMLVSLLPIDNILGSYEETSKLLMNSNFVVLILSLGILVPFTEELLYRGIVYTRIKKYLGVKMAIGLSAVMFGLFHFNLKQGLFALILGLLLAFLREKYNSLSASVAVHMAVNQLTVIFACTGFDRYLSRNTIVYIILMIALLALGGFFIYNEIDL